MTSPRPVAASLCALFVLAVAAAAQAPALRSPNVATYEMTAELRPDDKLLAGTQRITWTNTTARPTSEAWFHLYINAFRDPRSTLMREAGAEFRGQWRPHEFGGIELEAVALEDSAGRRSDLTDRCVHVQPDDGNPNDATVLKVPLPAPVGPGESITLVTRFTTKLPKAYRRTGWVPGGGFFCMHWFPKLGVLEEIDGRAVWSCHQFHANSEFFADFAVYDVAITVPEGFEIGATGVRQPERSSASGGRKTEVYRQADVHDFAWVADPRFVRHDDTFGPVRAADDEVATAVAQRMGVPIEQFDLPQTKIVLLLLPEHDTAVQRERHLEAVKVALGFFGLRFGPYPYPVITVVDPGRDILGRSLGGGMEYPMLITCGTDLFPHPRRTQPEGVTVHEFGHQYWYGLSANDEFEESWLDEGINSYCEGRAQWLHYARRMWPVQTSDFGLLPLAGIPGPMQPALGIAAAPPLPELRDVLGPIRRRLAEVHFGGTLIPASPLLDLLRAQPTASYFREATFADAWNDRVRMLSVDNPDAMVRRGWEYLSRQSYGANSYHRPATLLRTLERMIGRDAWWTFLRRFHAQARFAHPTTNDFAGLLAAECGPAPAAFFVAAAAPGAVLDYGIAAVEPSHGFGPRKRVVIRRYGTLAAEVQVRFRFANVADPVWRTIRADEPYPWTAFEFADGAEPGRAAYGRLLEVWIDPPEAAQPPVEDVGAPAGVYLLDANLLNNGWRASRDRAPALYRGIRLLLQAQSQLSFAGLIG